VRLRINWFSPLRPANTAIAHYALQTVPALARRADVVVWTQRAYWPREMEQYATVRRWDGESWAALNAADATLYHIGNDVRFHGWIWDVASRHPGVMVLHDTRLHEFFAPKLLEGPEGESRYISTVRRVHGEAGVALAQRYLRGETTVEALGEPLPLTAVALERARGAIVHTGVAFEQAVACGHCSVLQLDLPYTPGPPPPPRTWDGVLKMVVFGYLGLNRRIEAVLDGIAAFPDRDRLRLDIFGQHHAPASLMRRIGELGLEEVVRLRGFVPEPDLDAALDEAHLAINLRYPTMGEASASQVRIWDRGLASVVTRTGWYAELPPDTVLFVDPENELADLHAHFRAALADPDRLAAMGRAGRGVLEESHDPAVYTGQLVAGVERMMFPPTSVATEAVAAISRIADASGVNSAVRRSIARRAAGEVCRWLSPRPA